MDPISALVKHIFDADHRVSVNYAVLMSWVGNAQQGKLSESVLIKHIRNCNLSQTAIYLDLYTSGLIFENIPYEEQSQISTQNIALSWCVVTRNFHSKSKETVHCVTNRCSVVVVQIPHLLYLCIGPKIIYIVDGSLDI